MVGFEKEINFLFRKMESRKVCRVKKEIVFSYLFFFYYQKWTNILNKNRKPENDEKSSS